MSKNQNHKKIRLSRGIALVEVIAALGISVVVITTLLSLTLFSLRSSLESKLRLESSKIAGREIELVRAYRDTPTVTWNAFVASLTGCYNLTNHSCYINAATLTPVAGSFSEGSGIETITRRFSATDVNGSPVVNGDTNTIVRITTSAQWLVGGSAKETRLYTDLTNWRTTN